MWWFRWHARRFFNSVRQPKAPTSDVKWDRNLRLLYMFGALNALLLTIKYSNKKEAEGKVLVKDPTPGHQTVRWASTGGDVQVVNIGFGRPTERFTVNTEEYRREYENRLKSAKEENQRLEEEKRRKAMADTS